MTRPVRLGLAAMVAVALALTAAACGDDDPAGDAGDPVTLSYAVWDTNQVPAMKELAAAFTKDHPKITIDVQMTPWADYWTKLRAAVTGGAAPDVFWMNGPNIQLYADNRVIMPLSDRIGDAKLDMGVYPKPLVDLYTFEGKVYGLPKDFDTVGVWYNKELFDAAKVAYPAEWNVSEFSENEYTKSRVDAAPLPAGEKKATIIHGLANVVSAKTAHPEQAWEFVKYLGTRQAAEILGRNGPIPAYDGTQTAWTQANKQFKVQLFLDAVAYAVPHPVSRNTAAWNEAETKYLTKAYSGEEDVETAARALAADMNALLAKE